MDIWSQIASRVYLGCAALGVVSCVWALQLFARAPKPMRQRLFFRQLVALVVLNVIEAALMMLIEIVPEIEFAPARVALELWTFLDVATCLVSVQLALSFSCACLGAARSEPFLRRCLPGGMVLALAIAGLERDTYGYERKAPWPGWYISVLSCCGLCLLIYAVGMLSVLRSSKPRGFKLRALLRGITHVANVCLVFGAWAAGIAAGFPLTSPYMLLCRALYYAGGFVTVLCYVCFWMRPAQQRSEALSHNDTGITRFSNVPKHELIKTMLDDYFDIVVHEPVDSYLARRRGIESVAALLVQ